MKNRSFFNPVFILIIIFSAQLILAQISRNPGSNRDLSRIPHSDGAASDRGRDNGKTKERQNPTPNLTPIKKHPERPFYRPPQETPVYNPPKEMPGYNPVPEPPVIIPEPILIEYPVTIIIETPIEIINPALSEIEESERAIKRYDQILLNNPKDTIVYFLRGKAKLKTEDYFGAIEDLTTYINLVPWDKEAYYYRGLAYLSYGNRKEALLDFQIAAELGYKKGDSALKLMN